MNTKAQNMVTQSIENNNYIIIKIGYKSIRTLLDTGSGSTIMSERLARELKLPLMPLRKGDHRRLVTASGTPLHVVANCDLNINFVGLVIPYNVLVVRNLQENLIMGSDFLSQNNVIINYQLKTVSIADDLVRIPLHANNDGKFYVQNVKAVCLEPYSVMLLEVRCPNQFAGCVAMIEPLASKQFKQYAVSRSLCHPDVRTNRAVIHIMNIRPHASVIRKGYKIASIQSVNVDKDCTPFVEGKETDPLSDSTVDTQTLEKIASDYDFKINPELTNEQRLRMLNLLYEFKDVFCYRFKGYNWLPLLSVKIRRHRPQTLLSTSV